MVKTLFVIVKYIPGDNFNYIYDEVVAIFKHRQTAENFKNDFDKKSVLDVYKIEEVNYFPY